MCSSDLIVGQSVGHPLGDLGGHTLVFDGDVVGTAVDPCRMGSRLAADGLGLGRPKPVGLGRGLSATPVGGDPGDDQRHAGHTTRPLGIQGLVRQPGVASFVVALTMPSE